MKLKLCILTAVFSVISFAQNRLDYRKIRTEEAKYFLTKEDKDHRLSAVILYNYSKTPKTEIETSYDWKDGKPVFSYERKYIYDDKDSLVYYSQYSEIPSADYPELIEEKYGYDKNVTTIKTFINGELDSEVSTKIERNSKGKIVSEISPNKIVTTEYNQLGAILKETVKEDNSSESVTNYSYYKNGNLSKTDYSNPEFEVKEIGEYDENGKIVHSVSKFGDKILNELLYKYDERDRLYVEKRVENNKIVYKYTTFYNDKGQKIKYLMEDLEEKTSGIWLFDYDENENLKYKIDLFPRKMPAPKHVETQAVGSLPPPKP